MLTSVLHTERAIAASISIMEAFVEMRRFIANNATLLDKISSVELRQLEYQKQTDKKFDQIFEYIGEHTEINQHLSRPFPDFGWQNGVSHRGIAERRRQKCFAVSLMKDAGIDLSNKMAKIK